MSKLSISQLQEDISKRIFDMDFETKVQAAKARNVYMGYFPKLAEAGLHYRALELMPPMDSSKGIEDYLVQLHNIFSALLPERDEKRSNATIRFEAFRPVSTVVSDSYFIKRLTGRIPGDNYFHESSGRRLGKDVGDE